MRKRNSASSRLSTSNCDFPNGIPRYAGICEVFVLGGQPDGDEHRPRRTRRSQKKGRDSCHHSTFHSYPQTILRTMRTPNQTNPTPAVFEMTELPQTEGVSRSLDRQPSFKIEDLTEEARKVSHIVWCANPHRLLTLHPNCAAQGCSCHPEIKHGHRGKHRRKHRGAKIPTSH